MSESTSPDQVEFIRLNGVTVRVTSWRAKTEPDAFALVAITRGSRDAETLDSLFQQPHLTLEIGERDVRTMRVATIDRRTVGEGQAGITRYAVTLVEADAVTEAENAPASSQLTLEERVSALEIEVRALRAWIGRH